VSLSTGEINALGGAAVGFCLAVGGSDELCGSIGAGVGVAGSIWGEDGGADAGGIGAGVGVQPFYYVPVGAQATTQSTAPPAQNNTALLVLGAVVLFLLLR